ncbi:hypothetical protein C1645_834879 [Glomus cerebriforme]|uniref:Uncharacterized protein n=1 Tax=Glomus cerebriforme TaxID=658196 RepID=A0A397SIW7_9GLOM|nr:hypothetical protein C1645_834879 [Glomus cerebriforme]
MSSVRSNKSSTGTLKRVTRSQTIANNAENPQIKNTNLENEQVIIQDTYGPPPTTTNNTLQTHKSNDTIENTTVISTTIDISDRDIIMGNTIETNNLSQQSSSSSSLPAVTKPYQNLAHSIHASDKGKNVLHDTNNIINNENSFNTFLQSPPNVDHHTPYQQPINSDFYDANNITSISDTENLTINDNTEFHLSFAILNDFPGYMGIQNCYRVKIVKIAFYDEAEQTRYNKTVKLVDIPKHIYNLIILETVSKEIGPIIHFYEPKSFNSKQVTKPSSRKSKPSFFKQLKIEFENQSAVQKIVTENIWSLTIGDFNIRILPNEIKSIAYTERTTYQYKLTGLLINSTLKSLQPLLNKIHAKTCTFVPTDRRRLTRSAYIYITQKDFVSKNKTLNINNHNIYIMNPKLKHCTICGSPSHDFKMCSANMGPTTDKLNQTNNNNRLLLHNSTRNSSLLFKHPLNTTKRHQQHKQSKTNAQPQTKDTQKKVYQSQNQNDILLQQILKENAELKSLLQQSLQKINALQTIQKDITDIKKNVLDNKEKISQTNTKVDIVITRTEELNQNVLAIQPANKHDTQYRRKKEKINPTPFNKTTNKYNFNPQIDSFSDIGSLKTIESIIDDNTGKETTTNKYSLNINPPKHLINDTESKYMENINYEDSSFLTESLQDPYETSSRLGETSTSQWNFNPLRKWTS